ncbi:MAG: hypothetical protein AAGD01_20850 [Acidobacteriota bacterium]
MPSPNSPTEQQPSGLTTKLPSELPVALPTLYVVGGRQRSDSHFTDEWHHYREARVLWVDPASGRAEAVVRHESPPEACPEHKPSFVFKAGCRVGDRLYLCTQTEVLVMRGRGQGPWEREAYVSLPLFNDLHHVLPTAADRMLLANTGLDLVAEVNLEGEVLETWSALPGEDPWERFDRAVDYRRVATTKPHHSHPNYVFRVGEETWVTRFEQRDALSLADPARRLEIAVERPHDGVVRGDRVFHTTVDGRVVISRVTAGEARVESILDLNTLGDGRRALGWCRGILPLDERHALVGFSRLRPSVLRQNLRWVKHRFGQRPTSGDLPTRVALYDLQQARLLWEMNLEEHGLNALFSIHGEGIDDVAPVADREGT